MRDCSGSVGKILLVSTAHPPDVVRSVVRGLGRLRQDIPLSAHDVSSPAYGPWSGGCGEAPRCATRRAIPDKADSYQPLNAEAGIRFVGAMAVNAMEVKPAEGSAATSLCRR